MWKILRNRNPRKLHKDSEQLGLTWIQYLASFSAAKYALVSAGRREHGGEEGEDLGFEENAVLSDDSFAGTLGTGSRCSRPGFFVM